MSEKGKKAANINKSPTRLGTSECGGTARRPTASRPVTESEYRTRNTCPCPPSNDASAESTSQPTTRLRLEGARSRPSPGPYSCPAGCGRDQNLPEDSGICIVCRKPSPLPRIPDRKMWCDSCPRKLGNQCDEACIPCCVKMCETCARKFHRHQDQQ